MASAEPPQDAAVPFNAAEMLAYFAELDRALLDAGVESQIHLYVSGGAVIASKADARVTTDVDVVSDGMTEQLRRCVVDVSRAHPGLRPDWLNDGAKLHRVDLPMRPERIFTGERLVIDSPGDRYVLAMKLASARQIDESDCEFLIRSLGIRTEDELFDLIEQALPGRLRTPAMAYFAAERLSHAHRPTRRRSASRPRGSDEPRPRNIDLT